MLDRCRGTHVTTLSELIGRDDANDLDAILSVDRPYAEGVIHSVTDNCEAIFTWDYAKGQRPALNKLYEKAKDAQWNGETDLPWDTDVDIERSITSVFGEEPLWEEIGLRVEGTPMASWGRQEWIRYHSEMNNWTMSQFMHGEQGALLCTAKIVETVPWIDAKYYAATQVMDEARHLEVFVKYLDEKLDGHYPLNPHLGMLLDEIIGDARWDMTYLGMQIMVEGLALAAFGTMHAITPDPLLKKLLRYVMADEARHVAFGVLSLREYYEHLSEAELFERQEFAFEAAIHMRDRLMAQEVWERMGVDAKTGILAGKRGENERLEDPFQQLLFSKIVPNCKKLGLLEANDGWLRKRFTDIGVIQFEDWADTGDEYESLSIDAGDPEPQRDAG
ncbi:MAG: ferritin-like domain-containing protein [Acidimicrobiia bacterium]|nr:ferritin-like domain-containing protein [Acidimicrobiia bacterium]